MSLEGTDEEFGVEWAVAAKPESVDPLLRGMLARACEPQYRPAASLAHRLFELSRREEASNVQAGLFASAAQVPSLAGTAVGAATRAAIGFDCEWDVKFVKGQQPPVCVIQLGTGREAVVVHLPLASPRPNAPGATAGAEPAAPDSQGRAAVWGVPASVRELLEDESVAKLGINCAGDALKLDRDFGVRTRGLVDVAKLWAAHTGAVTASGVPACLSLKDVAKAALGLDIPKDDHLRIAPWSGEEALTAARMRYAALDAALPVRVLLRVQAELSDRLDGTGPSAGFAAAAEQPFYGIQPGDGAAELRAAESRLLPASAGPVRQAAAPAVAASSAAVSGGGACKPARISSDSAVTAAAAYSAAATSILAAQVLPESRDSHTLNVAAARMARLPWEARTYVLWMWKQVPTQRLASAVAKPVKDILGAILRAIEHRDGLGPPSEVVLLSERDGGPAGRGREVGSRAARAASGGDAPRLVSLSSGLPYRWAGLAVSPSDEAACLRRLRCLEVASGLAAAKLDPTPSTGGAAPGSCTAANLPREFPPLPASCASASSPPERQPGWHPVFGPQSLTGQGATSAGPCESEPVWAIQVCIDEGGCITAHPGLASLEWPGGRAGSEWAAPFLSLTLPLPLRPADVDAAWAAHGMSSDTPAHSPDVLVMTAVLIHVSRMGLRGVASLPQPAARENPTGSQAPAGPAPVEASPPAARAPPRAPPGAAARLQQSATLRSKSWSRGGGDDSDFSDDGELDASD